MDKLFTKIAKAFIGLSMAIGIGVAVSGKEAKPVEAASTTQKWTASSGAIAAQTTGTIENGDYDWSFTRSSVVYTGWSSSCIQLGSSGGAETVTLTNSNYPGTISSVAVECSSYKAAHKIAISVGDTSYLAATATPSWTTVDTKTGTGSSSGTITISFTNGTRALYIKSITVIYVTSDSTPYTTTVTVTGGALSSKQGHTSTSFSSSVASGNVYLTPSNGYMLPTAANLQSAFSVSGGNATKGTITTDDGDVVIPISNVNANITITGSFPTASYTITYNANGAGGSMNTSTNTVASNAFTFNTGAEFIKWNTAADGTGSDVAVGSTVTADTTLYCIWGYIVTYYPNGGSGSNITDHTLKNSSYTVANNTFTRDNYSFSKWKTVASGEGTEYAEGATISTPSAAINLYAQWEKEPTYEWVQTDLGSLTSTDVFVIVGNNGSNYAMNNDGGSSTRPAANSVTVNNNKITSTIADKLKWKISGNSTDGYVFYPNGSTTTWLYCTNTNDGVRVGTNSNKTFTIDGGYLKNSATSRYVGIYNSQDWRCYTSSSTNISGQSFSFYKRTAQSTNPRGTLEITSPSSTAMVVGDSGSLTYSWTPDAEASTATITSFEWTSGDSSVISIDNGSYSADKAGSTTITLTATDSTGEEYAIVTDTITVSNPPFVLPEMPNGDYEKVTSSQQDYSGYYLIVYGSGENAVAFNGDLTTLDASNNSVGVTIVDGNIIESNSASKTDTLNKSAVYISKNGNHYDIAANIGKENVVFIGRDSGSNGLDQNAEQVYENTISYDTHMVISGSAGKTLGYNNDTGQKRFRYMGNSDVTFYKKKTGVDTLRSIAIVSPTTSLKAGQKFTFGGSVTATYSQTGTTGHTGITSGLSFSIGGESVDSNTTMERGEYTVTVTYNDGTTSKSNTYTLSVGYADATTVTIGGNSSISVHKGYTGTFTATVSPETAQQGVTWSVTDTEGGSTSLGTINSSTGYFEAGNTAGSLFVVATSADGLASSHVTVTITGDPLIELDKNSISAYSIDNAVSLTATPQNFPSGTVTYSWSSNDTSVATVSDVSTATTSVSFSGGGDTSITVIGYVDGVQKATASCTVTVTKTRSVTESATLSATYDFTDVSEHGTAITDETIGNINNSTYFTADAVYPLDTPVVSLPDYVASTTNFVYFGNASGGAYQNQGGMIKLGKSKNYGSINFTFTHTITRVEVEAQQWTSDGGEGTIYINGTAPESNAGAASYATVVADDLSTTSVTISSSSASARVFVKSITFYSAQSATEIGRSSDVLGLESFVENKLKWSTYHNDHVYGDNTGDGSCVGFYDKNGTSGAKYAFNNLNLHQKTIFTTNSAYTNEWLRLQEWARANGEALDTTSMTLKNSPRVTPLFNVIGKNTNTVAIVVIISMVSVTAIGGYFFLRKRKENI